MRLNPFIFLNQAFKYIPKKQSKIIYTNIDFIEKRDYEVYDSIEENTKKKKKKEKEKDQELILEKVEKKEGFSLIYIDQNYEEIKKYNTEYIIIVHKHRFIYYLNNNFRNSNVNNKKLICSLPFSFDDENDQTIKHNLQFSILKNNEYND